MLADCYKEAKNISLANLEDFYDTMETSSVYIRQVYKYTIEDKKALYWVNGILSTDDYKENEFNIAVIMDTKRSIFSIIPWDYMEEIGLDDVTKISDSDLEKINNYDVKKNENNTIEIASADIETMAKEYLSVFFYNITHSIDRTYEMLNKEYVSAKFNDLDDFKEFVNNNLSFEPEDPTSMARYKLVKYKVSKVGDKTQYVCVDNHDRYYIFTIKDLLDYDIILDTYTIDVPEFTDKYNKVEKRDKVKLDINKFALALNDKDYKFAYNILEKRF